MQYGISAMVPPDFSEEERELLFQQLMSIADAQRAEASLTPEQIEEVLDAQYTEEDLLAHAYYWAELSQPNPDVLH